MTQSLFNRANRLNLILLYFQGEFYANDLGTANLELVARFFEKYPDYADKTFLSVKVSKLLDREKNHKDAEFLWCLGWPSSRERFRIKQLVSHILLVQGVNTSLIFIPT